MNQFNLPKIVCGAKVSIKCTHEGPPNQMLRIKWEGSSKFIDVCPSCFQYIELKELKYADIKKEHLKSSGYYKEGASAIDIKSYLEKWIKKTKEEI